jgi:recombination associated protein RdgC
MLFKNAHIYRLSPLTQSTEEMEELLQAKPFIPCKGIRPESMGWISPLPGMDEPMVHEVAGCLILCAKREKKVVPPSALDEVLQEKIKHHMEIEGRKLFSKEKQALKDDALAELLPRALPSSKTIMGYIKEDLLVIGTGSPAEAELFISCIRDSLGSFSVIPPQVKDKPANLFTHWIKTRKLPDHFVLGDECDLLDLEEGSKTACRNQDLYTEEVRIHLDAGKVCTRLGFIWRGGLRVTVNQDLALKQMKFLSHNDNSDDEDPISSFEAAFVNMSLELDQLLPELFTALGGEQKQEWLKI